MKDENFIALDIIFLYFFLFAGTLLITKYVIMDTWYSLVTGIFMYVLSVCMLYQIKSYLRIIKSRRR